MRLRTRGNANGNADVGDGATAAFAPTAASRTALGNISNREGNDEQDPKLKRTKPSGIAERAAVTRRGRSQAASSSSSSSSQAEAITSEAEKKTAAPTGDVVPTRRAPLRKSTATARAPKKEANAAAASKKETTTAASLRKVGPNKTASTAAAVKREATMKKVDGAMKRSSNDENNLDPSGRASKRAKKSTDFTTTTTAVAGNAETNATNKRTTRSRSRPVGSSSRRNTNKSTDGRGVVSDVVHATDENRIVPLDFRLKRDSFDGRNFTYGIAHYDEAERSDPLRCKDYVTDMFQHLYQAETDTRPRPYMDRQEDINAKMRAILVDWLVEVHMKFRLVPTTLYLCVHIIDRYCSVTDVARSKLQLVGVTALFLACKHEEIYPPEVRDCVYITDRAYDRQEVLDMEQTLLRVLDWKISLPTAYPFLDRFLSLTKASTMTRHTATYYLERTLQEHDLLEYRPSLVCASAVILALNNPDIRRREQAYARELPGLPKILMEYTEFDEDTLIQCMTIVAEKINEPAISASRRHLNAVRKKYEHRKYLSVSSIVDPPSIQYVLVNMSLDE